MDGLEAVEISWKFVNCKEKIRIDSEHYQKKYKILVKKLDSINVPVKNLETLIKKPVLTGHTPSMSKESYYGGNIKFIKTDNLRENLIQDNFDHLLSSEGNEKIQRSALKENDIVVTIIGATYDIIGRACLIEKEILPANINQNIALIRVDKNKISPFYLNIYLNTHYGRSYLHYLSRQTEQVNLNCREVEELHIPIFSSDFQKGIEGIMLLIKQYRIASSKEYTKAEDLLLSELGLQDWQPTEENVAVKSFAESFLACDRLDAEYYQPKQQKVMAIMRQSGLCIGDVAQLVKRKFQPDKQGEFNYIEIGNLSGEGFANGEVVAMDEAPSRAQWIVKPNDVITSTVRPIRRLSALIEPEQNNYICSSGFAVLKPTQIEPEVLLVYLRSPIVCEILDLHTTASMYPAISTEDLLNIPITLPKESTRQEITEKVRESRKAREQSKQLLEIAKTGVERAIETDEATAIAWINEQLEVLNIKLT
jgi:restriction endonuclease S subunit